MCLTWAARLLKGLAVYMYSGTSMNSKLLMGTKSLNAVMNEFIGSCSKPPNSSSSQCDVRILDVVVYSAAGTSSGSYSKPLRFLLKSNLDINVFTDGSRKDDKCGAGYHFKINNIHYKYSVKLPRHCTIFQCEIMSITLACQTLNNLYLEPSRICFYVDSQAALKAIYSSSINSRTVRDCLIRIQSLEDNHNHLVTSKSGFLDTVI